MVIPLGYAARWGFGVCRRALVIMDLRGPSSPHRTKSEAHNDIVHGRSPDLQCSPQGMVVVVGGGGADGNTPRPHTPKLLLFAALIQATI